MPLTIVFLCIIVASGIWVIISQMLLIKGEYEMYENAQT